MKENHDIIHEELKKFFLNEALTLCPSARIDIPEREKLWMLHTHLKRINKLMSTLHNQDFSGYMTEMREALSYYLVPNNETKKKKLRQNEHSIDFNQFAIRLPQLSDTIEHYYLYINHRLKILERVIKLYFPENFKKTQLPPKI